MSIKKQIDKQDIIAKLAKDLADAWVVDLEGDPHDLSEVLMFSDIANIAEQLVEQGYRKQSDGKWMLGKSGLMYFCSSCGYSAFPREEEEWNFCPDCGAKMKGGAK